MSISQLNETHAVQKNELFYSSAKKTIKLPDMNTQVLPSVTYISKSKQTLFYGVRFQTHLSEQFKLHP